MCLRNSSEFIKNNLSLSIWPEGAYIYDTEHVYKGRTGGARILFNALDNLCYAYFLPVSIDIKTDNDLDSYVPDIHDKVKITINEPILPDEYFYRYKSSETDKDKNIVLHDITDTGMKIIADSLNREYVDDYIELYPKGNVIFSDGTTINTELAQTRDFLDKYDKELKSVSRKLIYSIQK